jgi:hypothetical protein
VGATQHAILSWRTATANSIDSKYGVQPSTRTKDDNKQAAAGGRKPRTLRTAHSTVPGEMYIDVWYLALVGAGAKKKRKEKKRKKPLASLPACLPACLLVEPNCAVGVVAAGWK